MIYRVVAFESALRRDEWLCELSLQLGSIAKHHEVDRKLTFANGDVIHAIAMPTQRDARRRLEGLRVTEFFVKQPLPEAVMDVIRVCSRKTKDKGD